MFPPMSVKNLVVDFQSPQSPTYFGFEIGFNTKMTMHLIDKSIAKGLLDILKDS